MAWRHERASGLRPMTPANVSIAPASERRSVLDRAHRGDIEGALGRIGAFDTAPRRSMLWRVRTLLAIMGPGVVVMVANNDAGGLSTYAQAGQDHGLRLLWLVAILAPVLFVIQEMVVRLGAVTGAGHARLIFERFGRRWGRFALVDLLLLNFLTIVTDFIGVALALGFFGVSRFISVPIAALGLSAVTVRGSFRRWERAMYAFIGISLAAIPLALLSHPRHSVVSVGNIGASGAGLGSGFVVLMIAMIGTTVAPWQLFFHQSNVVDKRITPRWIGYERADTVIGTILFAIGAMGVLLACATAFRSSALHGLFVDAGHVETGLRNIVGRWEGALFALVLFNGSVLGAGAVSLATSYAIGDVFGVKHSLHRPWRDAPMFHGSFVGLILLACGIVLIPGTPLGVVTVSVQVLAGVLLPSATVFLLLLCNDRAVLGPWINPRWLNIVTTSIVAGLIALSALLTWTTLFGRVAASIVVWVVVTSILVVPGVLAIARLNGETLPAPSKAERSMWSMPPLESLDAPEVSRARSVGLSVLRLYVAMAAVMVVLKLIQSAFGR